MNDPPPTTRGHRAPSASVRRRRLYAIAAAVAVATLVVAGAILAGRSLLADSDAERAAERFGAAWEGEDYAAMYELLDEDSRERTPRRRFVTAYEAAASTATATGVDTGDASEEGGVVILPTSVQTAVFGAVSGELRLRVTARGQVEWSPELVFPGLGPGERLERRTRAPERAPLLARDGTVLAEGPAGERTSELDAGASAVTGSIGPPATAQAADELYERGFPNDSEIGLTGLEQVFEDQLAGAPGGVLRAGNRELATAEPQRAEPVRTTIDADLQEASALVLARLGAIVVLDASSGEVRTLVGGTATIAQPPGSTFKIVTTTAALEHGVVEPDTEFPIETAGVIDGVPIGNAGDDPCGGTFRVSFAESCNSVFAPLGVEVGSERLVETAERYGINRPAAIPGIDASTMPPADEIESDLELGSTAIGQGRLLVTPVRLAAIAQVIANDGRLVEPTLEPEIPPERSRVTERRVADTIEELMVGVTDPGRTGDAAAIEGVEVAGKTGTAELGEGITEHAWFTAFAPAEGPELAVAVMIANGGSGGEVAAPMAKTVLEAGL